jgi:hypothetical protein
VPAADEAYYSNFSQAYGLQIAREKGTGAYPSVEGSVALGSSDIMRVTEAAFRYVPEGKGRAQSAVQRLWLFILMALASMGRGERVSRVQFQCIRAFCDCLTIQIPTSKSDILGLMSYAKMRFRSVYSIYREFMDPSPMAPRKFVSVRDPIVFPFAPG